MNFNTIRREECVEIYAIVSPMDEKYIIKSHSCICEELNVKNKSMGTFSYATLVENDSANMPFPVDQLLIHFLFIKLPKVRSAALIFSYHALLLSGFAFPNLRRIFSMNVSTLSGNFLLSDSRVRNRLQEDMKKTIGEIPVETQPTISAQDWRMRNREQEENLLETNATIPAETQPSNSTPDWRIRNRILEDDSEKTDVKIPQGIHPSNSTSVRSVSTRSLEQDFDESRGKITAETQTSLSSKSWSLSNPALEEDFNKTSGKIHAETQNTSPNPVPSLSNPGLEEDFKKTSEKIHAETRTTSLNPVPNLSNPGLEEDFKKTSGKIHDETRNTSPNPEDHKLLENLMDLLYSDKGTDIFLRVQGRDFRSDRVILAARSTVFAEMFKNDMKEEVSGVIVLEDCDPDAFEIFLEHLHTGNIEISEDTVIRLYQIADKYDTPDLKKKCVDFMSHTISVDTFCEVAQLSLEYKESELLEEVVNFFMKNIRQVSLSDEWQTFQKEHPLLANEFNLKVLEYH